MGQNWDVTCPNFLSPSSYKQTLIVSKGGCLKDSSSLEILKWDTRLGKLHVRKRYNVKASGGNMKALVHPSKSCHKRASLLGLEVQNAFCKAFNCKVAMNKSLGSFQSSHPPRNKMSFLPSGLNQMESQILMPGSNISGIFPLLQKFVLSKMSCFASPKLV